MDGSGFEFIAVQKYFGFFFNSETPHKVNCVCSLLTLSVHLMQTFSLKKYHLVIRKVFIHYQCWTKSGIDHLDNVWQKHFQHFCLANVLIYNSFGKPKATYA